MDNSKANESAPADSPYQSHWLDETLPTVTRDAVDNALQGFTLALIPGRNKDWLAMAVRRSLAITLVDECWSWERTSNADIRAELERLGETLGSTLLNLSKISDPAKSSLWKHAYQGGKYRDFDRMNATIVELDWLRSFINAAAKSTSRQQGPWRQSEAKSLRVERAQYLALIFEAAFGQPVSANNYPNDARHKAPTPFMDFYRRMITLAFSERETVNLSEVTKAACRQHREHPEEFEVGLIPDL